MNSLSPAGQAFFGSIIRHLLTGAAGVLVAHGYVSDTAAHPYIEELVGVTLQGAVMLWSNRVTYWNEIHALLARQMPAGSTAADVAAKADLLQSQNALPSVFVPAHAAPGFSGE